MRLSHIEIENFKGIGTKQSIDLAPITLLFGPNSAGKSTILQALHYLREILERNNPDPDQTIAFQDLRQVLAFLHDIDNFGLGRFHEMQRVTNVGTRSSGFCADAPICGGSPFVAPHAVGAAASGGRPSVP